MSYALVFGGIAALVVFIGGIAALVWWIARPVSRGRRAANEALPLFSHAHASVWPRDDDQTPEEGAAADLMAARVAGGEQNRTQVPLWSVAPLTGGQSRVTENPGVPENGR
ncbi:hypothetical protein [Gemmatimonas sp.]|uniref:hypothetical protein n=1 Tax=Gemmatimonas sp. TaxID=1962908 RepID=UPI0033422021